MKFPTLKIMLARLYKNYIRKHFGKLILALILSFGVAGGTAAIAWLLDPAIKKIFIENEPEGKMAKMLYSIAEKIRYEKIGSDKLVGIKNNLTQCYENKFKNKKIEEIKTEADVPINEAFELYLRSHFFKIKQNDITKKVLVTGRICLIKT